MIVPTKQLKALVNLYPNRKTFCDKVGIPETTLSYILSGEREVPKSMIEALVSYTGWGMDELFEVVEK